MAVQKSKRSKSRRGQGRAHFSLVPKGWTVCKETGEVVQPHRVSPSGWYKGKKIFQTKEEKKAESATQEA
ncbi:50S ribosomal protein L32 [bacterium]|nr:50S ribosomal protein L32 [bacterium]